MKAERPARPVRKTLVATLIGTLAAAPLGAQMTIGVRGGVGTATLTEGPQHAETLSRSGITAGIDLGIPLGGFLDVRVGLGLAQKGGHGNVPRSLTAGRSFREVTARVDYLQFSTLLRASTDAEQGRLRLGVLAGPYAATNRSCEVALRVSSPPAGSGISTGVFDFGRYDAVTSCSEAEGNHVRSTDLGLAFGTAFEIELYDSLALAFDLIYAMGLSDIDDDGRRTRHLAVQSGLVFVIG